MMRREVKNGVIYYRSTLLSSAHAFSTRYGGVSTEAHLLSMNLGHGRGDSEETLAENYRRFLLAADLPYPMLSAQQIHSDLVLKVDRFPEKNENLPQCDGFVTNIPGVTLVVKIADCLPILLEDADVGVIGAVHAGWRGSARSIVLRALDKMEALGARRENIRAVIGPRIGPCCFEVKEDFVLEYLSLTGEFGRNFLYTRGDKIFCDLPSLNKELLITGGVRAEHIEDSGLCTCCDPKTFFSHRATGGKRGTMAAAISIHNA